MVQSHKPHSNLRPHNIIYYHVYVQQYIQNIKLIHSNAKLLQVFMRLYYTDIPILLHVIVTLFLWISLFIPFKECISPNYGMECSSTCDCGVRAKTCDPVLGCTDCYPGYEGDQCADDINECNTGKWRNWFLNVIYFTELALNMLPAINL